MKISCLDQQRKTSKREKDENIDAYVKEYMGRPLEKIHVSKVYLPSGVCSQVSALFFCILYRFSFIVLEG